jgi:hypothetical protein
LTGCKSLPALAPLKNPKRQRRTPEAGFFVMFQALASFLPPYFRSPLGERFVGDLP